MINLKKFTSFITRISLTVFLIFVSTFGNSAFNVSAVSDPGTVFLDKTAAEQGGGLYEITLKVWGIPVATPHDIVLVIDTSGSMGDSGRMAAAKDAAKGFVDQIIDLNDGHRIAVVNFANYPGVAHSFSTNKTTLKASIDALSANGGTHLEGGIYEATKLLQNDGLSANHKTIVVLGDGTPTYGYDFDVEYTGPLSLENRTLACRVRVSDENQDNDSNFTGRFDFDYGAREGVGYSVFFDKEIEVSGTCPNGFTGTWDFDKEFDLRDSVDYLADQAKALGYSIFSIGLSVDATGRAVLENLQNSGYYDANIGNLDDVYDAIATQVVAAARNALVLDKIGDDFEFVSLSPGYTGLNATYNNATRILRWEIGNVGSEEIILKYIVSIHPGLPSGEYPTNEYADLTYIDIHENPIEREFPKPYVEIGNQPPVADDDSFVVDEGGTHNDSVTATDPEDEELEFFLVSGPGHGSLTFNADGTYSYTHNGSETTSDSFTFKANDGEFDSNIATVTIRINSVNEPPVVEDDAFTVAEGGTHNDAVIGSDPEDDELEFVLVLGPVNGSLTFNADGTYTYTHNGGETTSDSFTFKANDGSLDSNIGTVTITVTPDNDPPVADDDSFVVDEGGTHNDSVTGSDPEDDELEFILVSGPANGSLTFNADGTYTYTHNGSETTSDSFTFKVNDGELDSNVATVSIKVNLVNEPPVVEDDAFTVAEGGTHNDAVTGSDPEDDELEFVLVLGPVNGSLTFNADGTYTYTHNGGETTSDSFTFKANDGSLDSNIGTVTITVTPDNDPPVADDDSFVVDEGGTHNDSVTGSDPEDDELEFILVSGPANGSLTFNADGTYTYTHNGSETTSDSFTFKVNDGELDSNVATVSIKVNPVNDPPVADPDSFSVDEGGTHNGTLTGSDPEDDKLLFYVVDMPAHGSLVIDGEGEFVYIHDGSETVDDSFTFRVFDGELYSEKALVRITINPDNDPPVADDDSFVVDEGGVHNDTATGFDPEGMQLEFILVSGPVNGSLIFNADGTYTYTHNGSETTSDSFTFKVNDGDLDSNVATVTIRINPVNDPPVADDDAFTTNEGGIHSHFVTGSDPESDELEFILISGPVNGSLTFNSDGTYTYTHNGSESTSDIFTFKVNDGELDSNVATVTITIIPVNEPPVALNDAFEVDQGESKDGFVVGTDPEDDELGFVLVNAPLFGTLVFNADGTYTYTHDNSENFEDVFTFKVNDGEFDSNIASVTILINATLPDDNEAPMADDSEFEVDQGESHNGLVTGSDPDGDEITFILVSGPAFGTLTFNPDGTYTYTHDDSENYDDSFTFKVFDGDVESDVATVTILINATLPDTSDNNAGLLGYGALLMGLLLWFVSKKKETHK